MESQRGRDSVSLWGRSPRSAPRGGREGVDPVTSASPSCQREAWGRGRRAGRARPREQSRGSRAGGNRPGAGAPQALARPPSRAALTEWPAGPRPGPVPPRAPPWPGPQPSRRRDRRRRCLSCRCCCCCCCSGKPVRNRIRPPAARTQPLPHLPSGERLSTFPVLLPAHRAPAPLSPTLSLCPPPPTPFFIPTLHPTLDFAVIPSPFLGLLTPKGLNLSLRASHPTPHRAVNPDLRFGLRFPAQACGEFLPPPRSAAGGPR